MCIDVRKTCECRTHTVQFHLRDNIMAPQVIVRLFCPSCPGNTSFDSESMLYDNGWIIEYDMDLARELLQQDRNVYLHAIQNWNIERIERLRSEGWRKVKQA